MIQEFHISITPVGQDRYWLRTESVAAGVPLAETQVTWPVEAWIKQADSLFQDPLQSLLFNPSSAADAALAPESGSGQDPAWIQLGQSLYQHLFQDRIRDSWLAAQGIAQNRRQTLRLRIGFKDSRLQRLPWELLYGDDRPLATGVDVILCRYYQALGAADLTAMPILPDRAEPVNVLVVISAPDDQERLSLSREVQTLIENLQSQIGNKPGSCSTTNGNGAHPITLNLTILEQPGRPELAHALEQGQFQVLHYAGHSDVSETGGELYLVNRQTGLTDWLSGEDLAGLLVNNGIRLAVFNSCRGAYTATDDAEAGWRQQNLVQALVNRGVPGVIAMAERIPDDVAVTFTRLLYRNLQQGYSIDLCLSRVRQGLISAYRSDQPFWMLPILYLRPDFDGYLYLSSDPVGSELNNLKVTSSEGSLIPPDYSTDPDISGLAEEILSGHAPVSLPDMGVGEEQTVAPRPVDDLPQTDSPSVDIPDLLSAINPQGNPDYVAETASVTHLVQQLSHPPDQDATLTAPIDSLAANNEALRPDQTTASTNLQDKLTKNPDATVTPSADEAGAGGPSPLMASGVASDAAPRNLTLWLGLGLCSLVAALALAIAARSYLRDSVPPAIVARPRASEDVPQTNLPGRDSTVISAALGAISENKPETARKFIDQLLDQGDLEAALSVIGAADPDQLVQPDIAFVRGRLAWQQMVSGLGSATAYDALRYWATAVDGQDDFLEAWVALGFANYELGDFNTALEAWEQAVDLDRQQLRDGDPAGQRRVSSEFTTYAYAGLAMGYQKLSELAPLKQERQQYQQLADTYFLQVIGLDPQLLRPEALALEWIWSPFLIESWETAVERISTRSSDPTAE